jgi:radical SAM superfamily enzyme YgiQ (UPF0313 family)
VILVTGDAYVDHPSFGMAIIGRLLEAQGFRVGIISQPDWQSTGTLPGELGRPNLFFGITAGNMDSMVNRYTADRRVRRNDAYTPNDEGGRRPDRAVIVYSQRAREAYPDVPIVIGGIEASLRRIAHYDYWSDKVRRSVLLDSRADLLAIRQRRARPGGGHPPGGGGRASPRDSGCPRHRLPARCGAGGHGGDRFHGHRCPGSGGSAAGSLRHGQCRHRCATKGDAEEGARVVRLQREIPRGHPRERTVIRLPAYAQVRADPVLYAHASRVLHLETNPGNARALVQRHGDKEVWLNPPPIPLTTPEMDAVFDLPYARSPHPAPTAMPGYRPGR